MVTISYLAARPAPLKLDLVVLILRLTAQHSTAQHSEHGAAQHGTASMAQHSMAQTNNTPGKYFGHFTRYATYPAQRLPPRHVREPLPWVGERTYSKACL